MARGDNNKSAHSALGTVASCADAMLLKSSIICTRRLSNYRIFTLLHAGRRRQRRRREPW